LRELNREAVTRFYEELFGDAVCETAQLVLWTPRDKRTFWTSSIEEAVAVSEAAATASDLYFGLCLQDKEAARIEKAKRTEVEPEQVDMNYCRGYASTTVAMPGLWLDLDIAGDGHEKVGLPKNQGEADRILSSLPLSPTTVLKTGGGTHIYWLFKEPWVFDDSEERDRAAALIRGWQMLAIDSAADMGFVCDATHDLPRVLRPLGTINHKYGNTVELVNAYDHRFNPSDFEDWSSDVVPVASKHSKVEALGDLREDIQPPMPKLMAMLNLAPEFAATWRRERREFPSQSEYDMSLASMAARAQWTDEEIVALVVSHRREGGEPLRLDRPRYFTGLIGKARSGVASEDAHERINERVESVAQGDSTPEDEREGFLEDISNLLGFRVRRVLKFLSDPPQFRLVLEEGTIHLGGVEAILTSSKFRASIAAVSGHLIQRFNGARWDPVAQAILQAVEELDLGADSSAEGLVSEWLSDYLAQHRPSEDRSEAVPIRMPFLDPDGLPAFFLPEFKTWLKFHRDETLGRRQIATLLRTAGVQPRAVAYVRDSDNHKTTISVWVVPKSIASLPLNRGSETELPTPF